MKQFLLFIDCLLLLSFLSACNKPTDNVGHALLPEYNKLKVQTEEFQITYHTIYADPSRGADARGGKEDKFSNNSIYVSSHYAYLGSIPNQQFGGIRSEYMTQFYVPAGFKFVETPHEEKIDSAFVTLYYRDFTGDGKQPMQVEIYKLKKEIPSTKYSQKNPTEFMGEKIGEQSYVAEKGTGRANNGEYVVRIPLSDSQKDFIQDFYQKSKNNDQVFASQKNFNAYFPGIYLRNTAGKGSILRISRTALTFYYRVQKTLVRPSTGLQDSVGYVTRAQELSHTTEVPQASFFGNYDLDRLVEESKEGKVGYIKAPAGVFTELTLPTRRIAETLKGKAGEERRRLNSFPLILVGEQNDPNEYFLTAPATLLLLPKDSLSRFFEKEKTDLDAPLSTYISKTAVLGVASYNFGNIAPLIQAHIAKNPQEDLKVVLVPIERTTNSTPTGESTTSIVNQVFPAAVRFKAQDGKNGKIEAVIESRKSGSPF